MIHLDLFSGIGGFAYAADQVFKNVEHTFCENNKFCQQILKKHWPESKIYEDIKKFNQPLRPILLTGGFPCQPFSAAGVRRGISDDRYLWPEMLRVVRLTKPEWVIAENVRGILTWQKGVVFEQVCADLEDSGYEVQAFIIPACGVNAPHRRDRVWFVANSQRKRLERRYKQTSERGKNEGVQFRAKDWERNWLKAAAEFCRVDDGFSAGLDRFGVTESQHRKERLKSLGNAIVPQIAIEIMSGLTERR